jgi:hypothetical protein
VKPPKMKPPMSKINVTVFVWPSQRLWKVLKLKPSRVPQTFWSQLLIVRFQCRDDLYRLTIETLSWRVIENLDLPIKCTMESDVNLQRNTHTSHCRASGNAVVGNPSAASATMISCFSLSRVWTLFVHYLPLFLCIRCRGNIVSTRNMQVRKR